MQLPSRRDFIKPYGILAIFALISFCLAAYFFFQAIIDSLFAVLFLVLLMAIFRSGAPSSDSAISTAVLAKIYPPLLTHTYLFAIFGQLGVVLACMSFVARVLYSSRSGLEYHESDQICFRWFFSIFLAVSIVTGLLTFASVGQYGFPLGSLRTLTFWAFIVMCLASELAVFSLASKSLVTVLPRLLWIFSLWTRLWSYIQLEKYEPFELGAGLTTKRDFSQLFWYRFVECLIFSFPFFVGVAALPPASFRILLGDLIPTVGRGMVVVGVYLALMYSLFVLEIVGVKWKGSRVSVKRLHVLLWPSIVLSFVAAFWTWVSVNLTYVLFVIWLYLAAFGLLSVVMLALEPLIVKRFQASVRLIARRSGGRLVLDSAA